MSLVVTVDVENADRPSKDPLGVLAEILAVVDRHRAPVTFFVQGRWALAHPGLVREIARRDPTMGLHGFAHVDHRRLSPEGVRAETRDGLAALAAAVPEHRVRWCRLPYGFGADDPTVAAILSEAGLEPLGWDRSSYDWDPTLAEGAALARVLPAATEGGVTLFHSWPERTPRLLDGLFRAAGPGGVRSVADVELPGRGPQGPRRHLEIVDLPRHPSPPGA